MQREQRLPNAASRARDSAPVRKRQSRLKPDFQLGHALQGLGVCSERSGFVTATRCAN